MFHLPLDGGYAAARPAEVLRSWEAILPGRLLPLRNLGNPAATVVDAIARTRGRAAVATRGLVEIV